MQENIIFGPSLMVRHDLHAEDSLPIVVTDHEQLRKPLDEELSDVIPPDKVH